MKKPYTTPRMEIFDRRQRKTLDIILAIVALLTVAFTVTMICLFAKTGGIPDTLVSCWFVAVGGECGVCGWIKTTKERNQQRRWEIEDRSKNND